MGAHAYWRLSVSSTSSGNVGAATIEFRASVGGADQCSGGTAISSSTFDGTTVAANAFDGNAATKWAAIAGLPAWIGYQFPSPVSVAEVLFVARNDIATQGPLTCQVESSDDGTTWSVEWTHTAMASWSAGESRALRKPVYNTPHLYWRLYCQRAQDGLEYASLAEVELRGVAGGVDQCVGGTASADSNFSDSFVASNAFDDSTATIWNSGSGFPHWLAYQFASTTSVVEVAMTARNDATFYAQAPASFIVQSCDDGKAWADEESYSGVTWSAALQQKVFTLAGDVLRSSKALTYAAVGTIPDVESVSKALSYAATGPGQDTTLSTTKALSYGALGPGYDGTLSCTKAVTYAVLGPGGISQQRITVALVCRARQAA